MDKVLVNLVVPGIGEKYDVYIPVSVAIRQIIELLRTSMKELSNGKYISSGSETLCLGEPLLVLNGERNLGDYYVKNGDTLFFI